MKELINTVFLALIVLSCSPPQQLTNNIPEQFSKVEYGDIATFTADGEMHLYCKNDTLILTQELLVTNSFIEDQELLRCLYDEMFIGNADAIDAFLKILDFKKQSTLSNVFSINLNLEVESFLKG